VGGATVGSATVWGATVGSATVWGATVGATIWGATVGATVWGATVGATVWGRDAEGGSPCARPRRAALLRLGRALLPGRRRGEPERARKVVEWKRKVVERERDSGKSQRVRDRARALTSAARRQGGDRTSGGRESIPCHNIREEERATHLAPRPERVCDARGRPRRRARRAACAPRRVGVCWRARGVAQQLYGVALQLCIASVAQRVDTGDSGARRVRGRERGRRGKGDRLPLDLEGGGGGELCKASRGASHPPPPLDRTNRTSLVPPLVLSGHVSSLTSRQERRIAWSEATGGSRKIPPSLSLYLGRATLCRRGRGCGRGGGGGRLSDCSPRKPQFCKALSFVKFRRGNLEGRDPRVDVGKKVLHARALLPDRLPFPRGSAR
jgi:hypothetical protein